ncbi:uncharacterized protein LOC117297949 [Asterias rubens]|uniref:uncharacterized protein LOC117297949 n=1 Tax=Asterias rubens TaxID=7604 RepID=UPI00145517BB|nr:uncharacterized protein LOC117297949 [Asterias rubens]
MRKEEGRSVFMASFQEKQLLLEERKENTAPKPVSNASAFYSRGRQIAGYSATDALLQSRQTNSNVTPGFLSVSNSKRLYPITSYPAGGRRASPQQSRRLRSVYKDSQILVIRVT